MAVKTPLPVVVVLGATPAPPPIISALAANNPDDVSVVVLEKYGIPPLVVVPPAVTGKVSPDAEIVLHPNPEFAVHVSALEAPWQSLIETAVGEATPEVALATTVLAPCVESEPKLILVSVLDEPLIVLFVSVCA